MKKAVVGKILDYAILVGPIILAICFVVLGETGRVLLTIEILVETLMVLRIFIKPKEVDAIFVMRLESVFLNLILILMTKAIFFP